MSGTEATRTVGGMVHDDVARLKALRAMLRRGSVLFVTASHLAGTMVLWMVVFLDAFPYPAMYLLMGILLTLVLVMKFLADYGGRRVSAWALLVVNLLLTAFWVAILLDQIPDRPVIWGRLEHRLDLPVLYVPIVLYCLAAAGLVFHSVIHRRHARMQEPGST